MAQGRRIEIEGIVQGVGFRPWVYRLAHEMQLGGQVWNGPSGVTIEAFGNADTLDRFVQRLCNEAPPAASVRKLDWKPIADQTAVPFHIVASTASGAVRVSIPADLATCAACAAELFDPANRRYRYPFINCTDCGPRFTIAQAAPYDRPATTMAHFRMCAPCQREYDDPGNRRFHAQPNACPVCGPRLRALDGRGVLSSDTAGALRAGVLALQAGKIVAVKGIGGYHLACDARSESAVALLRERKQREEKPFAVMVANLAAAQELAQTSAAERALLSSIEAPIVLLTRRTDSAGAAALASGVAPHLSQLGLMLAYSPLHHLLLRDMGGPLVMTSANLSDEPIAYRDDDARERLAGIADLFLVHDRDIDARCEDSVARVIAGAPVLLRRSRGYVPRMIPLARAVAQPVLAVGAHLKNTFCLAAGDAAVLGPHIGDLENSESYDSLVEGAERMQRFLDVRPKIVAHDLHPDYLSTRYAQRLDLPAVAVQHHHAHVASAMAEHGLTGPVLGLAFDGTGLGDDGALWGGEFLLATFAKSERVATLRPMSLAGGERAIREVWRLALALLDDAFDGAPPLDRLALFAGVPAERIELMRQIIARKINAPKIHGVGRLFDAVGALALGRASARYEGQIALEWNLAAAPERATRAPSQPELFAIDESVAPWQLDLRPLVRAIIEGLLRGTPVPALSALFHYTLAAASAEMVRRIAARFGAMPVVLTGGCFQNARLAEGVLGALAPQFDVRLHRAVPPGDGGIALGQALVADARLRE